MEILITNNEEKWQEARKSRFTASEIYKLMGSPKNKSEYLSETAKTFVFEKAAEILTGQKKQIYGDALQWGKDHEKTAFEQFEKTIFCEFNYYGGESFVFIPYGEHSGYSPDALGENSIVEIKNPYNSAIHLKNRDIYNADTLKQIHPEYYWQMQLGLLATKNDLGYFVSHDIRMPSTHNLFIAEIELQDVKDQIDEKLYYASQLLNNVIQL